MEITLPNNWRPRGYQMAAWSYLERGGKHAELIWHRRSGKDEISLHRAACAAFERIAGYWHMLPEYAQARKAVWDAVNPHTGKRRIDEAFPLPLRKRTRNDEMIIEFVNGSTWQVVGSDRYDSLVGSTPAGIIYSEWALANPNVRAYLRPIIAENNGWQIFITTPRGRNHAHKTFEAARRDQSAFAQILSANETDVFSAEQLLREEKSYIDDFGEDYGRAKFEQEYLCSFEAANMGAILARQLSVNERAGLIADNVDFDPFGAPIEISADIGHRDSSTWWFWQPRIGGYAIIDYDGGNGLNADEWCEKLKERIGKYRFANGKSALGCIWLPHDARNRTFAAQHSAVEIFIKMFGSAHVRITPDSKIADRVNAARVVTPKVAFNADKCARGLDGLRSWSYRYDSEAKIFSSVPEHDWASHDGDGYSYGCLIMQQLNPIKKEEKIQTGLIVGTPTMSLNELWDSTPRQRNTRL